MARSQSKKKAPHMRGFFWSVDSIGVTFMALD